MKLKIRGPLVILAILVTSYVGVMGLAPFNSQRLDMFYQTMGKQDFNLRYPENCKVAVQRMTRMELLKITPYSFSMQTSRARVLEELLKKSPYIYEVYRESNKFVGYHDKRAQIGMLLLVPN